jgi:HEAT repeat protein
MIIDASCANCKRAYRLPDTQVGKRVRCKGCGDAFVVVAEEEVPILEEASDADVRRAARKQREEQAVEVLDDVEVFDEEERVAAAPKRRARRDQEDEDDRPRRSRRDDDDEEERPRRSRREEDEDEEEEEEPAKKGGGGVLVVLGIVAGCLLLLCGGGGGLAYYVSRKAADNLQANVNNLKPDDFDKWKNGPPDQDKGKVNPPPNQDGGKVNPPINQDGGKVNPPPNNDNLPPRDVSAALAMLKDGGPDKKRVALQFLITAPVESSRSNEVEKAVEPLESDLLLGDDAGKVLDRWAPSGKIDRLAKLLESKNSTVYLRAMDRLSNMKEERAAEVLANQFKEPGREADAAKYLPRMGKLCEKYVLVHYNSGSTAQAPARRVLDAIGTTNEARVRQCVADFEATAQPSDDKIQEVNRNLKRQAIADTLQKLKVTKEIDLNEQVSKQLEPALSDKNPFLVDSAFKAMETWMVKDSVPAVIDLAKKDAFKKPKAIKLLIKFPEHESVPPFMVSLLPDASQRDAAGKALIGMGTRGEKAILDAAKAVAAERDVNARRAAYQILGAVGTRASLGPLREFVVFETRFGDKNNAIHAENARKAIQRREGLKVDPTPPKDKDKTMPKDKAKIKDKVK